MEQTCARAVDLGLPAVAFTEHVDHDGWPVSPEILEGHEHLLPYYQDGILTPGELEVTSNRRTSAPGRLHHRSRP
jgi:histidinol-phosphatase (PHP family)